MQIPEKPTLFDPAAMEAEAKRMLRDGTMPSREKLEEALERIREEFGPKILKAREQDQMENNSATHLLTPISSTIHEELGEGEGTSKPIAKEQLRGPILDFSNQISEMPLPFADQRQYACEQATHPYSDSRIINEQASTTSQPESQHPASPRENPTPGELYEGWKQGGRAKLAELLRQVEDKDEE